MKHRQANKTMEKNQKRDEHHSNSQHMYNQSLRGEDTKNRA